MLAALVVATAAATEESQSTRKGGTQCTQSHLVRGANIHIQRTTRDLDRCDKTRHNLIQGHLDPRTRNPESGRPHAGTEAARAGLAVGTVALEGAVHAAGAAAVAVESTSCCSTRLASRSYSQSHSTIVHHMTQTALPRCTTGRLAPRTPVLPHRARRYRRRMTQFVVGCRDTFQDSSQPARRGSFGCRLNPSKLMTDMQSPGHNSGWRPDRQPACTSTSANSRNSGQRMPSEALASLVALAARWVAARVAVAEPCRSGTEQAIDQMWLRSLILVRTGLHRRGPKRSSKADAHDIDARWRLGTYRVKPPNGDGVAHSGG